MSGVESCAVAVLRFDSMHASVFIAADSLQSIRSKLTSPL
jgi:hypothetical protein